jgi:hypothetical protein
MTFDLQQMPTQSASSGNDEQGNFRMVNVAFQPPQVMTEAPKVDMSGRRSETLAIVRLISDDLTVLSGTPATEQPLDKQWTWKVKPTQDWTRNASFTFQMDFVRKTEGMPDAPVQTVWKPANPFRVPVGAGVGNYLPWLLLLLLLGLACLLIGILLWRRRPDLRIDQSDRQDPLKRITHISGLNPGTDERWTISTERAIEYIENGKFKFHTLADDYRAPVIIRTSRTGNKYVMTVGDTDHPNNLLSLPELAQ